ncbi:MAG: hypothetical protein IKT43_04375 [Clostridia bacterium]|nr:hypothetical protein [Clostridia bacterium]
MGSILAPSRGALDSVATVAGLGALAVLLAVVATILTLIFITPEKKYATLPKGLRVLADIFNFKGLLIEAILKTLYIFSTLLAIFMGFVSMITASFFSGLLMIVLAPIGIRFVFELLMMAILAVKNIISINNKLKNQNEIPVAPKAPVAPVAPKAPEVATTEEAPKE